jgi:hypothetical protein
MGNITVAADMKGNPAGIGHPTMLFGEALAQGLISKCAGERDVDRSATVDVPNLRMPKAKFSSSETMRVGGLRLAKPIYDFRSSAGFLSWSIGPCLPVDLSETPQAAARQRP